MKDNKITSASTAEYFSKNLQQIGFSSPTKAVLTTIKEAIDNSLDACEEHGILPERSVSIERLGSGTMKGTDLLKITVTDNGPGIEKVNVPKVFGEYLASSKFGRGRCSRGQQGLGISAATTWAQTTAARGVLVTTRTNGQPKAYQTIVEVDMKHNKGLLKNEREVDADFVHGTRVEFILDGKVQLNGEAGLITYLTGTALVNTTLTLHYKLLDAESVTVSRVSETLTSIPDAVEPHPHTLKLGEFISHAGLFGHLPTKKWLKTAFSRMPDSAFKALLNDGLNESILRKSINELDNDEKKSLYTKLQNIELAPPSTKSVRQIGEDNLAKSIQRLGEVDFFAVVSRNPTICDFKPVQVEIAVARLKNKKSEDQTSPVQILRFANLVPLQFDKKACVTVQAVESVNWKAYGLDQAKESLPTGPFIIAISIVSPFIKFKNASKETIDASDELLQEIRLALIQVGQKLSKFVKKESKESDLEQKRAYIEKFTPILLDAVFRISQENNSRRKKAEQGLRQILGREEADLKAEIESVDQKIAAEKKDGATDEQ